MGSNANPGCAAAESSFEPASAMAGCAADRYTARIARPMSAFWCAVIAAAMSWSGEAERDHQVGARGQIAAEHRFDRLLARPGRLPHLGQVVALEVGVEDSHDVADPAADQFGPVHDGVHDVAAAPVVADEVDRALDGRRLGFEPVAVVEVGRPEPVWQRYAETRRRD
ncbi:hypothetical protein [Actinacidiphila glaucinigra]|uniref:hypothetical protein n=1 Tax=Actinacidiphila glaucinigra TaxID=235986 RepID=UPI0037F8C78F